MGFLKLVSLAAILISLPSCQSQRQWNITQTFDGGRYVVTRHVDMDTEKIQFEVVVETLGFVGFGLSPSGGMEGADIVIGGVDSAGAPYFNDYHAIGESTPIEDTNKDWTLDDARENGTHTSLTFSRLFDTCDAEEDVVINEDTLSTIWAVGETDTIRYHGARRGYIQVYLLDPPVPLDDVSAFKRWEVLVNDPMPANQTTYLCSIHQTPDDIEHHHVVGFDQMVIGAEANAHTHHFIYRKCFTTPENEALFADYAGKGGSKCYPDSPTSLPHPLSEYCGAYLWVWGTGGTRTMLPEDVGFPIAEIVGKKEYFMLEVHYDNPTSLPNIHFETGLVLYHTKVLREKIAGVLMVGHEIYYGHMVPPNSADFKTVGHCTSECTRAGVPEDGINIFNILLHSHYSGRKLKLRQFRNGKELPWAASDGNYNFDFQINRPLRNYLKVLPGDHLTYECVTDTHWKNGEITLGGMGSADEMCDTIIMYYPRMDAMDLCESTYPVNRTLEDVGIGSVGPGLVNPTVLSPSHMAGRTYGDVLTNVVDWTPELRARYKKNVAESDHEFHCGDRGRMMAGDYLVTGITNYPTATVYEPENNCENKFNSAVQLSIGKIFNVSLICILFVAHLFQQ